jgi:hypothetical protein
MQRWSISDAAVMALEVQRRWRDDAERFAKRVRLAVASGVRVTGNIHSARSNRDRLP